MKVQFLRCPLDVFSCLAIKMMLMEFAKEHKIKIDKCTLDFRKTRSNYRTGGLFGGLKDLYDPKTKSAYINLYNFVEYQDKNPNIFNIAHLAMHELIHIKQVQNKQMKVLGPNKLKWKGKIYTDSTFDVSIFEKIMKYDGSLAEEYHCSISPWETDAYKLPEKFMEHPLWKKY